MGSKLKEFFSPRKIWFHLLLAVVITILLIVASMIFLRIYTRHGQEVKMPNFVGQQAEALLADHSSDFIIVISDYVFDKSVKEGTVLRQNPEADEMVKKGRKVYLSIASSVPPKVLMPELKDVSLRQAEIMLKAIGLELEGVIYKPSPFENAVLEQLYKGRSIAANTEINQGDKITLVVGKDIDDLPAGSLTPADSAASSNE